MQAQQFTLTPAMREVIARSLRGQAMVVAIVAVVVDVLLIALAVYLILQPGDVVYGAAIIVLDVLIFAGFWLLFFRNYWRIWQIARKDLNGGIFQRLTGPMRTGRDSKPNGENQTGNYFLIYGGRRLPIDKSMYDKVAQARVSWGTIEETPNGHVIFSIRDANGQLVYQHPEYTPEEIAAG